MNAMPSSGNREYVIATMTRALAWAEVFVLIPLHVFWVVFKSTPFAAENRASLLVLLVPAGAMILAGWPRDGAVFARPLSAPSGCFT